MSAIVLFESPEMRCGKSTVLNILRRLVVRPLQAANVSTAAIFRTVEAVRPTLLVDEADTFLAKSDELRGVINSGHEKHGAVIRVDGDQNEPRVFATFAATAIAGIGHMPGTIDDRSIVINMKRRKATEPVERLRGDRAPELDELASRAARWTADNVSKLKAMDVDPPAALSDRAADGWRPLLAIDDLAGGDWPETSRHAAVALSASSDDEESIRVMLLKDIKSIFNTKGEDKITSEVMITELQEMEERPWGEFGRSRKPITKTGLANLLRRFAISPNTVRTTTGRAKGYRLEQFTDAFDRYLTVTPLSEPCRCDNPHETAPNGRFQTVTPDIDVTVSNLLNPAVSKGRHGVTVQNAPEAESHTYQLDDDDLEAETEERLAIQSEPSADPYDIPIPAAFDRRNH